MAKMVAWQIMLDRAVLYCHFPGRGCGPARYQTLFSFSPCNTAPRRIMLLRRTSNDGVSKHHFLIASSMGSIRYGQLMRWVTGALMLLLVQGVGAPRSAWAGCNHLVSSRSDAFLKFDQLDELIQGHSIASSSDDLAQGSRVPKRNRPCSGMSCSGRVPMPVSTASQGFEGFDQWGALATVADVLSPSLSARPADEPGPRAKGQATSIFHPPRA